MVDEDSVVFGEAKIMHEDGTAQGDFEPHRALAIGIQLAVHAVRRGIHLVAEVVQDACLGVHLGVGCEGVVAAGGHLQRTKEDVAIGSESRNGGLATAQRAKTGRRMQGQQCTS